MRIISSLFIAWFLSLFGFHNLVINGVAELFSMTITKTGYYLLFVIVGIVMSIFQNIKNKDNQ